MIAGCYDMRLTCDGPHCKAGEYGARPAEWCSAGTTQTESEARREARADGWRVDTRRGIALCKTCVSGGWTLSAIDPT